MNLIKVFIFLFAFLFSVISLAGPCEDKAFSDNRGGALAFIAFVKEKGVMGGDREITSHNIERIQESTANWSYSEATLFLQVLVGKIGTNKTTERITQDYSALANIELGDFMQKLKFYDAISPDVASRSLSHSFTGFKVQNNLHKTANPYNIKNTYKLIKTYIGITGAINLLMTKPSIYTQANHKRMKNVMIFVEKYIRKHKIRTPLKERLNTTDIPIQLIELQQAINHLKFSFFEPTPSNLSVGNSKKGLQHISLRNQVISMFSAFSQSTLSNLKQTVRFLKIYIPPEEISEIMLNHPEIFTVKVSRVKKNVHILKSLLKGVDMSLLQDLISQTKKRTDISYNEKAQIQIQIYDIKKAVLSMQQSDKVRAVIAGIIRDHSEGFLTANPEFLMETIHYLSNKSWKTLIHLMTTKIEESNNFIGSLLTTDPVRLKAVESTIEPYFDKKDLVDIIFGNLGEINQIDHIHFEKLITLLKPYLNKQDMNGEISFMFFQNQQSRGFSLADLSLAYKEWEKLINQLTTKQIKNILQTQFVLNFDPRQQKYEYFLENPDHYIDLGLTLQKALSTAPASHTLH